MNDDDKIEVSGLAKRFGDVRAVESVTFGVRDGELFGLLGPNGAGKTTTINMLTGLARPDAGSIRIAGIECSHHPKAAQHLMGVVPDESNLYPELTGYENLCFCGALYGMPRHERDVRARKLLESFGLSQAAERKFGGYSKGMKRKLTIAAGIIHQPPILFLDEPTTGIDVASARQIRQLIAELNVGGTTMLLTTHYIEEAERLCRRIAFIVEGRIVRLDSVENLMRETQGRYVVEFGVSSSTDDSSSADVKPARNGLTERLCEEILTAFPSLQCQATSPAVLRVESSEPVRISPLVHLIEDHGGEVTEARKIRPSLEDVFVHITGIEAHTMKQEREKTGKGDGS